MSQEQQPGPRRVTMADVAREAGVSRPLVSLVIRDTGYVSPEKRELVLAAAEKLGYRRNSLAASLAGKKTFTVGFAVLDIHNQVYADLADGIADAIEPAGYQLLLATSRRGDNTAREIEALVGLRVDGIVIATHGVDTADLSRLLAGVPAVIVGEDSVAPMTDAVHGGDRAGASLATEHLLKQGHRDVAYIAGPPTRQNTERRRGYLDAMSAAGLPGWEVQGDATEAGGTRAVLGLLRPARRPTALFCYNDSTAIGALSAAEREGVRVPDDLAVVGYDNTRAAGYPGVMLTSVDQHAHDLGRAAADLLLERIADPQRSKQLRELAPRLVIRQSSSRFREAVRN